jgi:hypothetical protein
MINMSENEGDISKNPEDTSHHAQRVSRNDEKG